MTLKLDINDPYWKQRELQLERQMNPMWIGRVDNFKKIIRASLGLSFFLGGATVVQFTFNATSTPTSVYGACFAGTITALFLSTYQFARFSFHKTDPKFCVMYEHYVCSQFLNNTFAAYVKALRPYMHPDADFLNQTYFKTHLQSHTPSLFPRFMKVCVGLSPANPLFHRSKCMEKRCSVLTMLDKSGREILKAAFLQFGTNQQWSLGTFRISYEIEMYLLQISNKKVMRSIEQKELAKGLVPFIKRNGVDAFALISPEGQNFLRKTFIATLPKQLDEIPFKIRMRLARIMKIKKTKHLD